MIYAFRRSLCLLLSLLALAIEDSHAQSFVPTGNMMVPRYGNSATVLQDGRVLIAGGDGSLGSAEIYDPVSGTFAETGAPIQQRFDPAAVLLGDGRVLLVGGCQCTMAELYNPKSGTFRRTGDMSVAQVVYSAILLKNGKVLVVGGITTEVPTEGAIAAELFDPATETFVSLSTTDGRYGGWYRPITATLLADGTVLLASDSLVLLYDPVSGVFRQLPNSRIPVAATATPLLDGSVLFAGGGSFYTGPDLAQSMVYDPETQVFKPSGNMTIARTGHTATLLKDGRVLIAGGIDFNNDVTFSSAELFNPSTGTYSQSTDMLKPRTLHTATLLRDGRVLITGNWSETGDAAAELFVPESTQGIVPRVTMDRPSYCVGDSWELRAEAVAPLTSVQISGTWDGVLWTIPNWKTSGPDGTFVATGTYTGDTVGDYTLWLYAGGKVSNSIPVRVETCSETVTIPAGGAGNMVSSGWAQQVRAGYASASINGDPNPYGTAVFSLMENGVTVSEAGVPASGLMKAARLFIDFRNNVSAGSSGPVNVNTGIAMVNPGSAPATISLRLLSVSGQMLAAGSGSLNGGSHLSLYINEMQTFAPDFVVPADFPDSVRFASLEISSTTPISLVGLRLIVNQRGETLMTSTPVADLSLAPLTATLVVPQFADGAGFTNTLILLNTSASTESGTIRFRDDKGTVVPMTLNGAHDFAFTYEIPADGAAVFETDRSDATVKTGWIEVVPAAGTNTPAGSGMFRLVENGIDVTESAVPTSQPGTHMRVYIDTTNGHNTGIAFANPGNTDVTISLSMASTDGVPVAGSQATLTLPALGHMSRFIGELLTWGAGLKGVVEISASGPLAVSTQRALLNQRGDILLTSLPVADLSQPAPVPIFPQIADGGGFQTEIICISPGTVPVSATLQDRFN